MRKLINLDEAAEILGLSVDDLVEARSDGEIHGYRDGMHNWKFKREELERFAEERGLTIRETTDGTREEVQSVVGGSADQVATPNPPKTVSIEEAAEQTGLTPREIVQAIQRKELPARREADSFKHIHTADLQRFAEQRGIQIQQGTKDKVGALLDEDPSIYEQERQKIGGPDEGQKTPSAGARSDEETQIVDTSGEETISDAPDSDAANINEKGASGFAVSSGSNELVSATGERIPLSEQTADLLRSVPGGLPTDTEDEPLSAQSSHEYQSDDQTTSHVMPRLEPTVHIDDEQTLETTLERLKDQTRGSGDLDTEALYACCRYALDHNLTSTENLLSAVDADPDAEHVEDTYHISNMRELLNVVYWAHTKKGLPRADFTGALREYVERDTALEPPMDEHGFTKLVDNLQRDHREAGEPSIPELVKACKYAIDEHGVPPNSIMNFLTGKEWPHGQIGTTLGVFLRLLHQISERSVRIDTKSFAERIGASAEETDTTSSSDELAYDDELDDDSPPSVLNRGFEDEEFDFLEEEDDDDGEGLTLELNKKDNDDDETGASETSSTDEFGMEGAFGDNEELELPIPKHDRDEGISLSSADSSKSSADDSATPLINKEDPRLGGDADNLPVGTFKDGHIEIDEQRSGEMLLGEEEDDEVTPGSDDNLPRDEDDDDDTGAPQTDSTDEFGMEGAFGDDEELELPIPKHDRDEGIFLSPTKSSESSAGDSATTLIGEEDEAVTSGSGQKPELRLDDEDDDDLEAPLELGLEDEADDESADLGGPEEKDDEDEDMGLLLGGSDEEESEPPEEEDDEDEDMGLLLGNPDDSDTSSGLADEEPLSREEVDQLRADPNFLLQPVEETEGEDMISLYSPGDPVEAANLNDALEYANDTENSGFSRKNVLLDICHYAVSSGLMQRHEICEATHANPISFSPEVNTIINAISPLLLQEVVTPYSIYERIGMGSIEAADDYDRANRTLEDIFGPALDPNESGQHYIIPDLNAYLQLQSVALNLHASHWTVLWRNSNDIANGTIPTELQRPALNQRRLRMIARIVELARQDDMFSSERNFLDTAVPEEFLLLPVEEAEDEEGGEGRERQVIAREEPGDYGEEFEAVEGQIGEETLGFRDAMAELGILKSSEEKRQEQAAKVWQRLQSPTYKREILNTGLNTPAAKQLVDELVGDFLDPQQCTYFHVYGKPHNTKRKGDYEEKLIYSTETDLNLSYEANQDLQRDHASIRDFQGDSEKQIIECLYTIDHNDSATYPGHRNFCRITAVVSTDSGLAQGLINGDPATLELLPFVLRNAGIAIDDREQGIGGAALRTVRPAMRKIGIRAEDAATYLDVAMRAKVPGPQPRRVRTTLDP